MANQRKTGGREELDAAWGQINALIADATAIRSSLLLGLDRGNAQLLGQDQLAAEVTDLTAIRAEVIKLIADAGVIRDRRDRGLVGHDQIAATVTDMTAIRNSVIASIDDLQAILDRHEHAAVANPDVANGSTAGRLKTTNSADFRINGALYTKAATDDLWDLSAEVDTDGTHFRAYWLYINASGTASYDAGTDELSEAAAIAALPAITDTEAVFGVFVAGVSCDFDAGGGLAAQGTIYNGWPSAYALTASDPAALTTSTTVGLADGTTAGFARLVSDAEYQIDGVVYRKAATDDLWDLSGETDTGAAEYRAYWLYLDASGVATIAAGTEEASAADAIAALPALAANKSVVGVFVADPSCDFDDPGGLDAQGDYYDGWASAYTLTASSPAALTTSTSVGIADGSTAGNVQLQSDVEYQIAGKVYRKAATDDLWDLSGKTDTIAAKYRAYWLYLNAAGTASVATADETGASDAASAAAAIAALPAEDTTKCPVGVFVAGPLTDFDDVGGLDAQGDYHNGRPAAVSDPAALTSSTTTLVSA